MTLPDHIRLLRLAEHWARGYSKEFDDHVIACAGSLALTQAEGGAITLQGHTTTGGTVSICLTATHIHLLRAEACAPEPGVTAIQTIDHSLPLPAMILRHMKAAAQVAA
jgi:hypothetical protein